jgi:MHS family proline/betaine transporter-like MFS transporter
MGLFSSLSYEQKEALGLLQIGTFLEYFDLMLYIHMAVLLNELFFPATDSHTAALLTALAFCSTYVMRPIGALIFGWLGDNIGRRSTIIITTVMMSVSCVLMANLPTYSQIGITATWLVTICRVAQGMSSMGEFVGAQIYVTESISRPFSYPAVAFVSLASMLGGIVALGVAALVTNFYMNWRLAFWIGAVIALVGAVARTRLRETPEFLEMKRQKMKERVAELSSDEDYTDPGSTAAMPWKEPIKVKTLVYYFLVYCGWPLSFYLAYMYFNPMLKQDFGYTSSQIIMHNFYLSIVPLVSGIFWALLSYRFHPIRIMKVKWVFIFSLMLAMPFLILTLNSPVHLFLLQASILILHLGSMPGEAVFYIHLPIYRRFTFGSFLYALSRALMYIITAFGLVFLGDYFGPFGLWFITLPITVAFLYGLLYFEGLERKLGIYPNLTRKKAHEVSFNLSKAA